MYCILLTDIFQSCKKVTMLECICIHINGINEYSLVPDALEVDIAVCHQLHFSLFRQSIQNDFIVALTLEMPRDTIQSTFTYISLKTRKSDTFILGCIVLAHVLCLSIFSSARVIRMLI